MAPRPISEFQMQVAHILLTRFPNCATPEWGSEIGRDRYAPRLDIAIGPFATGNLRHREDYDRLACVHRDLLECLHGMHLENVRAHNTDSCSASLDEALARNPNARCFLAIEIENRGSCKHLLGGTVNAVALGRLGITVGWTDASFRSLLRARDYLLLLARFGKNSVDATNLLVLRKEQIAGALGMTY